MTRAATRNRHQPAAAACGDAVIPARPGRGQSVTSGAAGLRWERLCARKVSWAMLLPTIFLSAVFLPVPLAVQSPAGHAETLRQAGPVPIGMVASLWGPTADMIGLRDGLEALGLRQDEHFTLGVRSAEGVPGALETLVRELVRDGAEILYVTGWSALHAARRAAPGTPVVFAAWYDPLQTELGAALRESGGNLTGVINAFPVVSPGALQAFRQLLPRLKRVLVPYDEQDPRLREPLRAWRAAAARMGIELLEKPVRTRAEARAAVLAVAPGEVDGILPAGGRLNISGYALQASTRRRVPVLFSRSWMADYGGLASYGPSWYGLGRRAARLMDKILKGAEAQAIPWERNGQAELVVNLRTAEALGLSIPPEVLSRAARVIRSSKKAE